MTNTPQNLSELSKPQKDYILSLTRDVSGIGLHKTPAFYKQLKAFGCSDIEALTEVFNCNPSFLGNVYIDWLDRWTPLFPQDRVDLGCVIEDHFGMPRHNATLKLFLEDCDFAHQWKRLTGYTPKHHIQWSDDGEDCLGDAEALLCLRCWLQPSHLKEVKMEADKALKSLLKIAPSGGAATA